MSYLLVVAILIFSFQSQAKDFIVGELNKKFSQEAIKIKKGDTIVFKNNDKDMSHNLHSDGPQNAFDYKIQQAGQDLRIKFDEAGKTEVVCAIHPGMKISVEIEGPAKPQ